MCDHDRRLGHRIKGLDPFVSPSVPSFDPISLSPPSLKRGGGGAHFKGKGRPTTAGKERLTPAAVAGINGFGVAPPEHLFPLLFRLSPYLFPVYQSSADVISTSLGNSLVLVSKRSPPLPSRGAGSDDTTDFRRKVLAVLTVGLCVGVVNPYQSGILRHPKLLNDVYHLTADSGLPIRDSWDSFRRRHDAPHLVKTWCSASDQPTSKAPFQLRPQIP